TQAFDEEASSLQARPLSEPTPKKPRPEKAKKVDRSSVRAKENSTPAPPAAKKKTGAELLAELKAKKSPGGKAPIANGDNDQEDTPKSRAAEILAAARLKRQATPTPTRSSSAPRETKQSPRMQPKPSRRTDKPKEGKENRRSQREPRGHAHIKKGVPPWLTISAVLVLGGATFGLWWILQQDKSDESPQPSPEDSVSLETPEAPTNEMAAEPPPPEEEDEEPKEKVIEKETANKDTAPKAKAPSVPFEVPEAGEPIQYQGITEPALILLAEVTPLPKWSQCSDEEWVDILDDLELYLEDSGAQSNRAGKRLVETGRPAFPAIVNAMLKTDWSDSDSISVCSSLNLRITEMSAAQKNFGWSSTDQYDEGSEEHIEALLFNKKVVAIWHNQWLSKFSVEDAQWTGFAEKKTKAKPKEESVPDSGGFDEEFDD
ncbi:MAG: hypothetical protein QF745_08870, partial [Planctomycetota bacterium]|nr:hypothetical protein [Planctomycetota bacterium]